MEAQPLLRIDQAVAQMYGPYDGDCTRLGPVI